MMINRKDLIQINEHMMKHLDHKTIQEGYGKFKERYEYLLKNFSPDIARLEELWREIKRIQEHRRHYIALEFEVSPDNNLRMMLEFHNRYTKELLIKFYPDRGKEFVENELREYIESRNRIELFDAYFMLFQYAISDANIVFLLDRFTFK
ncbi:MAG: hypothetical protein QW336_00575 [Candidatus Anstonellales archaeon]